MTYNENIQSLHGLDFDNTNQSESIIHAITRQNDGYYNTHGWYWSWGYNDDPSGQGCEWVNQGVFPQAKSGPLNYTIWWFIPIACCKH